MPDDFLIQKDGSKIPIEKLLVLMKAAFEKNAAFQFRATGISMSPMIKHGQVVKFVPVDHLKTGMVVGCLIKKKFVIHRIMKTKANMYLVRGDNAPQSDGWVQKSDILGRVESLYFDKHIVKIFQGRMIPFLYWLKMPTWLRRFLVKLLYKSWKVFYVKCKCH